MCYLRLPLFLFASLLTLLALVGGASAQTRVPADLPSHWVDTGVTVTRGTLITLDAAGTVNVGPPIGRIGPEGLVSRSGHGFPSDSRYRYGLVARLTVSATNADDELREDFAYGERRTYCSGFTARLWLTVNDNTPADDSGAFTVSIATGVCQPDDNGVTRTRVHVTMGGASVKDAEVWIGGMRRGITDIDGNLDQPGLAPDTPIVARLCIRENRSGRGNHASGSTHAWNYREYLTNLVVRDDATLAPFLVTDTSVVQEIALDGTNVLIGVHLVMSVEWDATRAELDAIAATTIPQFSQTLYNATDGQFFLEQVEIVDDAALWDDADVRLETDWSLRANAWRAGMFATGGFMTMSRVNGPDVYTHEFGHFGLDVGDEYTDDTPTTCTLRNRETTGPFGWNRDNGGELSACLMAVRAPKLCSTHPDNPHATTTRAGAQDCWSHVLERYRDVDGPGGFTRWRLKSPVTRGAIVGTLPDIPVSDWRPRASIANHDESSLCGQRDVLVVSRETGEPLGNVGVELRTAGGRTIFEGKSRTDDADTAELETGRITLTGVHEGDLVSASGGPATVLSCSGARSDGAKAGDVVFADPAPLLAATLDVEPGTSRARVVVQVAANVKGVPSVRIVAAGTGKGRRVKMAFDASTKAFVGFASKVPVGTGLAILVDAPDTSAGPLSGAFRAMLTSYDPKSDVDALSADGVLAVSLSDGGVVAIGGALVPPPPIPEGSYLAAGPYSVATASSDSEKPGIVRFVLPDPPAGAKGVGFLGMRGLDLKGFAVYSYDRASGSWTLLPSTVLPPVAIVTAATRGAGVYALVARPAKPGTKAK